ncbi:MAG TPA: hypothetical protein VE152_01610, partial [Acidimicrobiales bacterium]|nr:hypothetical protein [Acidimicrobiales bacterium]
SYHHPHSVVSYAPGNAAAATTVAGHVPGGATTVVDPHLQGAAVVLTIGSSYARPGSPPPPSTARPSAGPDAAPGAAQLPPWDPRACT